MSDDIASMSAYRARKKPRSMREIVEGAFRRMDSRLPKDLQEPPGLVSGDDMEKLIDGDYEDEDPDDKDSKRSQHEHPHAGQ